MSPQTSRVTRPLLALTGLGILAAGWASYLWWQLLRARAGFDPVCLGGGDGCSALWDGDFAAFLHGTTGLPVAAWGVVWGIAAATLPLRALGRLDEDPQAAAPVSWVGVSGLLSVAALLIISFAEANFCGSCAVTHAVTLVYGAVALLSLGKPSPSSGLATFAVAVGTSWLVLLYPGLRTPKDLQRAGQQALQQNFVPPAQGGQQSPGSDPRHSHDGHHHPELGTLPDNLDQHPLAVASWPLDPIVQSRMLEAFVAGLEPQVRRAISELLVSYRDAPYFRPPDARALLGSPTATLRITDFSDTQCGHCAQLFMDLRFLKGLFPAEALGVDSRHFPLDGHCNPHLEIRGPEQARCTAAKARICMETHPERTAFEETLYRNQHHMEIDQVFELAATYVDPGALKTCIDSPETEAKLARDVTQAWIYRPSGTPLVLVNGKQTSPFGPFLYLLTLAGGDISHPAVAQLMPPSQT
ncbi:MAG: vitamin K epoxide reductase family protein [Acidobacteriota bacterium]